MGFFILSYTVVSPVFNFYQHFMKNIEDTYFWDVIFKKYFE